MYHEEGRRSHKAKYLIAFLAGAGAALIVGGLYLFGPRSRMRRKRAERWMEEAGDEALARIEQASEFTREKYDQVVDEILSRYAMARQLSEEQVRRAAQQLKGRWQEVKRDVNRSASEAARDARDEEM